MVPTVDIARAARCMSQNQSYRRACLIVLHVDRPARKKGDERKSCASEYSSSHVPARWGGMTTSAEERGSVERRLLIAAALTLQRGTFHVRTLQWHYKKISDPLEEISDQKGYKSLPEGRKFQLFGNL
jgi:hypothetical protein